METFKKPEKVTREVAQSTIDSWLDRKKVYEATREAYNENIEILIEAVTTGDLVLDHDKNILTHKLLFPEVFDGEITELTYRARLNDNTLKPHMQGVKSNDAEGRLAAYGSALTSQPKSVISKLDTADKKIVSSIVLFFL